MNFSFSNSLVSAVQELGTRTYMNYSSSTHSSLIVRPSGLGHYEPEQTR